MKTYALELAHDGGKYFIRVRASSIKAAKEIAMQIEKCPERSIVWIQAVKPVSRMGA